jgi:hypothetical protein
LHVVVSIRYAPRKKFMKLKEFETPFDTPPPLMELLVLPEEALPVLCVVSLYRVPPWGC